MPPRGRLPLLLPAVVLAGACLARPAAGYGGGPPRASSWQRRLDRALLDVDAAPQARARNLQKALLDPDLPVDVSLALRALRRDGFGKGHPAAIDALWPVGTTARADLEGLFALRQQVPEALEALRERAPDAGGGAGKRSSGVPAATMRASLPTREEIEEGLKNALRSTPKGLEAPKYVVERTLDGALKLGAPEKIELRRYEAFQVASTPSTGGAGFTTLAAYLFGENEEKEVLAMTMPVLTERAGGAGGTTKFVLPASAAAAPPTPLAGAAVALERVPARLVAVRTFPGLATAGEVARQEAALRAALAGAGVAVAGDAAAVLEYNAPLTLPWRRRNELALVVAEGDRGGAGAEDGALARWRARPSATSWFDAGVRLQRGVRAVCSN